MIFDYRCKGTKNYLYTQEKVQKKISGCYLSRALSSIHVPKLRFSSKYSDVLALPIANTAFGLRWGPPMERRVWETTQTKSPGIEMISGLRKWRLPTLPRCNFRSPIGDAVCGRLCRLSAPCVGGSAASPRHAPVSAHTARPTPSATADTARASEAGLAMSNGD